MMDKEDDDLLSASFKGNSLEMISVLRFHLPVCIKGKEKTSGKNKAWEYLSCLYKRKLLLNKKGKPFGQDPQARDFLILSVSVPLRNSRPEQECRKYELPPSRPRKNSPILPDHLLQNGKGEVKTRYWKPSGRRYRRGFIYLPSCNASCNAWQSHVPP